MARISRRVLVSGSTGLIGRRLTRVLRDAGDVVVPLLRRTDQSGATQWYVEDENAEEVGLSGFDVVVHLAGEPVGTGRWTAEKKRKIFRSRVQGTQSLVSALVQARQPPAVFLCASGINFYGDRGDTVLDETQPKGHGFLAEVCEHWEAAAEPLLGVSRVVHLRIGVVLARESGILPMMLVPFRVGLGGRVGDGRRYLSWITLDDLVRAVQFLMGNKAVAGVLNLVAPDPVTNREFTAVLGRALRRPAFFRMPAWALKLLMGQLAKETVLSSVRAVPRRLLEAGFRFQDTSLEAALTRLATRDRG